MTRLEYIKHLLANGFKLETYKAFEVTTGVYIHEIKLLNSSLAESVSFAFECPCSATEEMDAINKMQM